MSYAVYKEGDNQTPVMLGEVEPGATAVKVVSVKESGRYILTIGCVIPPNVRYVLPPCTGTGGLVLPTTD